MLLIVVSLLVPRYRLHGTTDGGDGGYDEDESDGDDVTVCDSDREPGRMRHQSGFRHTGPKTALTDDVIH